MQYSKGLIMNIQKYWKEEFNLDLNEDTANQYLDSFADLFLIFSRKENREGWVA